MLERASEAAWNAILSKDSVGRQIEEQVEKTWWELNGWGTPPERMRPPEQKPAAEKPSEVIEHSAPSLKIASDVGSGAAVEQGLDVRGGSDQPEAAAQLTLGAGARAAPREALHSLLEEVQYVPLGMDVDQAPEEGMGGGAPPMRNGVPGAAVSTAEGENSIEQSPIVSDAPAEAVDEVGVKAAAVDVQTSVDANPATSPGREATAEEGSVKVQEQDQSEPVLSPQDAVVKRDDLSLKDFEQEHEGSPLVDGPGGPAGEDEEKISQNKESSLEGGVQEKGDSSGAERTVSKEVQPSSTEAAAADPGASEVKDPGSLKEGERITDVQLHPSIGPEATEESVPSTGPSERLTAPALVYSSGVATVSSPIKTDVEMTEAVAPANIVTAVEVRQLQTGDENAEAPADVPHAADFGEGVVEMEEHPGNIIEEQGATRAVGQPDELATAAGAGSEEQVPRGLDEVEKLAGSSNLEQRGSGNGTAAVGALASEHMMAPQAMEEG